MKNTLNYLLSFLAVIITCWLLASAETLPDTQLVYFPASHFFWEFKSQIDFDFTLLLVMNILSLPIFIFFLKFLILKSRYEYDFFEIFLAIAAGIISALPNAGIILLAAVIFYFILMITFNSGLGDTWKIIKLTMYFYTFFIFLSALSSNFGIILSSLFSLIAASIIGTILETAKIFFKFTILILLTLLMFIIGMPTYQD